MTEVRCLKVFIHMVPMCFYWVSIGILVLSTIGGMLIRIFQWKDVLGWMVFSTCTHQFIRSEQWNDSLGLSIKPRECCKLIEGGKYETWWRPYFHLGSPGIHVYWHKSIEGNKVYVIPGYLGIFCSLHWTVARYPAPCMYM